MSSTPDPIKNEVLLKSKWSCCICQAPIIQIHHIDENRKNNDFDNLAPLCPNHHKLAHDKLNPIGLKLKPDIIKKFRDEWYIFCEKRDNDFYLPNSSIGILKIKNFISDMPEIYWAKISWKKKFSHINSDFKELNNNKIIDQLFNTPNLEAIEEYLRSMKSMYQKALTIEKYLNQFKKICACWHIDYQEL